ncbi:MAG: hypothetical protein AB1486_02195 [Planctomycetota bacterium]
MTSLSSGIPLLAAFSAAVCWLAPAPAHGQTTTRASVDSAGLEGNGRSRHPTLSAAGRFVAFASSATNLVPSDTNESVDIFVHDRQGGITERVSVATGGGEANGWSYRIPAISPDGRFVAFHSAASNLVANDSNQAIDAFVHDRHTGTTTRVSLSSSGDEGNGDSYDPSLSADGRFVAFWSRASNLIADDTNGADDVFVHDVQTASTTRVSVSSVGDEGNGVSANPSTSADGRFVAFWSVASNLVNGDVNGKHDCFVHDRQTGVTTRVSVSSPGDEGNGHSREPSISADGRFIAFWSKASNLVPGDLNNRKDCFIHDTASGTTTRVSVSSSGLEGDGDSLLPVLSADGNLVVFTSSARNLVPDDTNELSDVFVHDRTTGTTMRVSLSTEGSEGNGESEHGAISPDGSYVTFRSFASNLVADDTNEQSDVFVTGPELTLEVIPTSVAPGEQLTLATWNGIPGDPVLLWILAIDGSIHPSIVAAGTFDATLAWTLSPTVPSGFSGFVITLQSLALAPSGRKSLTNAAVLSFE